MLKKMVISMITMTILISAGIIYYLQQSVGETFGRPDSPNNVIEKSFENEQYYYFLSDEEIRKAIEKGISSIELIEDYLLQENEENTSSEVAFAYIETPFFTALKKSRELFDHFGRRSIPLEIKRELLDQYLPIHIRFYENKGYVYDLRFIQGGEEIKAYNTITQGSGSMKTMYMKVEDLDFSQPATVIAEDKVDTSVFSEFKINFNNYLH